VRETFECAVALGSAALEKIGVPPAEVAAIGARIRQRDQQRLELELVGGLDAGKALFSGTPAQLAEPAPSEIASAPPPKK
jgi:glutathione-regulated potassium-efflux system protein KefB